MFDHLGYVSAIQIYESSNSRVYRARRVEDNQSVILKVLREEYPSPSEMKRYRQEYEITRSLDVAGVIRTFAQVKLGNTLMMVVEDFGGEALDKILKLEKLSLQQRLEIASKLARALADIHARNVVHKDINPANIVYNRDTGLLKIIDFGIASRFSQKSQGAAPPSQLEGTLAYMAPEQTGRMNRTVDHRSDLYSVGCLLYEMFTGRLPFLSKDPMGIVHGHIATLPVSPHEIAPQVPEQLSQLIVKLLAKAADERYQTAWGLAEDLEECSRRLTADGTIAPFPLARFDISDRCQIPQKLYGREEQAEALTAALERAAEGAKVCVMVTGYSGIGKSSLVHELQKPVIRMRGYFVSGKYDQFQRNVPASAITAAFRNLVQILLTEGNQELSVWRTSLLEALGPNGRVIMDVIPEVAMIIGEQPSVQSLGPVETQNRFNLVFQSFFRAFCRPERPLVLFLDDLQWVDSASLQILEAILSDDKAKHFLLVGAYRDNEVSPTHPLMLAREDLRRQGLEIETVELQQLALEHVTELIADTVHRSKADVTTLANLVMSKTSGNPFFVGQFLKALYEERLLVFHPPEAGKPGAWHWDTTEIEAKGITDNVVDLMIGKLRRLDPPTQEALRLAACIGNQFDLETLGTVREMNQQDTYKALLPALLEGLVVATSELELSPNATSDELIVRHFRFLHDRVQQAAYALIDESLRKEVHWRIGQLLVEHLSPEEQHERVFELVDHLNQGAELLADSEQRRQLADLNLTAGRRAQQATAYVAAQAYFDAGMRTLLEDAWTAHYALTFALHLGRAEAEYLSGNFEAAEKFIALALEGARTPTEKAEVYRLLIVKNTLQAKYIDAIEAGRNALALLGVDLPRTGLDVALGVELERAAKVWQGRDIASLIDLPKLTDPAKRMSVQLLNNLIPTTYYSSQELFGVTVMKAVNLSLEYGNDNASSLAYTCYGILLGAVLGQYTEGAEFGLLAYALAERFNDLAQKCQACTNLVGHLLHFKQHARHGIPLARAGFQAGLESGDLQFCGYIFSHKLRTCYYQSLPLEQVLADANDALQFSERTANRLTADVARVFRSAILTLAGASGGVRINEIDPEEQKLAEQVKTGGSFQALSDHHVLMAKILYLFGHYKRAWEYAEEGEKLVQYSMGTTFFCEQRYLHALIAAALYNDATDEEKAQYRVVFERHADLRAAWAKASPYNFGHGHLLVEAEIARVLGRPSAAVDLYEQAIQSARENDYTYREALANELAGRFWVERNKPRVADAYFRDAFHLYRQWGAEAKCTQMDKMRGGWLGRSHSAPPSLTVTTTGSKTTRRADDFDLSAVIKASQLISGEIVLSELAGKLLRLVLENAGAERACLLLLRGDSLIMETEAAVQRSSGGNSIDFTGMVGIPFDEAGSKGVSLPASIIHYVMRTAEPVVLADATASSVYATDAYVVDKHPRSLLCMPLSYQGRTMGILYLENNLVPGAFTSERLEVLKVLSAQAAISITNARLYASLEEHNVNLERRVAERTRELEERNAQILRTQKQMVMQEKMAQMGILTAGVAHELKNPLNFVINFAESCTERVVELDASEEASKMSEEVADVIAEVRESLKVIRRHGKRANDIVSSMMDLARGSKGEHSKVDLNRLVSEFAAIACKSAKTRLNIQDVTVHEHFEPAVGQVSVVSQSLSRVVINLVTNAVEAVTDKLKRTPSGYAPIIDISTHDLGDAVELRIKDNGPGISEQDLPKIWAPFFTTKPTGLGNVGLGLGICYDIVHQEHGGEIRVETLEGKGCEFIVKLPR